MILKRILFIVFLIILLIPKSVYSQDEDFKGLPGVKYFDKGDVLD